jgi:hypothetical protein
MHAKKGPPSSSRTETSARAQRHQSATSSQLAERRVRIRRFALSDNAPLMEDLALAIVGLEVSPTVSVPLARLPVRCGINVIISRQVYLPCG